MPSHARVFARVLFCCAIVGIDATLFAKERVAEWGEPDRIVVEGAKTFSPDDVREALVGDLDVVAAGHPQAPLEEYLTALADRAREGYMWSGFPRATAQAHLDHEASKIIISIEEGPRFATGGVRVKGAVAIDAARLVEWLTTRQPSAGAFQVGSHEVDGKLVPQWMTRDGSAVELKSPAWEAGKEESFAAVNLKWKTKKVRQALNAQGYWLAKFDVSFDVDEEAQVVSLVVDIKDEGRLAKIDHIEVTGSTRDSAQDVIEYLGLQLGLLATEQEIARMEHKLWLSGNYLSQSVKFLPPKAAGEPSTLRIQLKDNARTFPLRQ